MKRLLLFSLCLCCTQLKAQDTSFTLADAVLGQGRQFSPERIPGLQWVPGQDAFTYLSKDGLSLLWRTPSEGEKVLMHVDSLKMICGLNEARWNTYRWLAKNLISIQNKQTFWVIDIKAKKAIRKFELPENAANPKFSPDANVLAYTIDQNLFIHDGVQRIQITQEPENVLCGQTVHRNEFGIHDGIFWAPNSAKLAFYRKDERMVSDYPLSDFTARPAKLKSVKYPMAGMVSEEVTVGLYEIKTAQTIYLKTGLPADQYLINPTWTPASGSLLVGVLNRDQNFLKMNEYDAITGNYRQTLFEERDDKYVQPLHPPLFVPEKLDHFVWLSERDGNTHFYLYTTKGKMVRKLTGGNWTITQPLGFDKEGYLHFIEAENRGLDRIHRAVDIKGKIKDITLNRGVHNAIFSDGASYYIDVMNSTEIPTRYTLYSCEGIKQEVLLESTDPYKNLKIRKPELGVIATEGEIPLNYRLIKPYDFDPKNKYRVLLYVYNGPGVQLITNSWNAGAPLWMQWLANRGWVIMTIDGRGSENRGKDFEQAIFRNLGEPEVVDQMKAVEWLYLQPWADKNRMAVHGWSYGGFMTTSLMLKAPGIFDAGVAGGPVMDWKYYEVMYTERYMDTPETNPEGFDRASLLNKAKNLKGHLLIIHGNDDDVVVPQHSIDFLKSSVDAGIQVDFFLYPGHQHNVMGKDRVHLIQKVTDYIETYVK
jgi:dipeptidyl-peptidase-4